MFAFISFTRAAVEEPSLKLSEKEDYEIVLYWLNSVASLISDILDM